MGTFNFVYAFQCLACNEYWMKYLCIKYKIS